jgi:hypothetical protein
MHKNHQILEILKKFSPNHQFEAKITRSGEISPDLATLNTSAALALGQTKLPNLLVNPIGNFRLKRRSAFIKYWPR